jgi:hypothetical protein
MSNKIHELSCGDLDEVSGGLRDFPASTSITPSIPIPPPEGHGPVVPPGHGPFFVNGAGVFEL